LCHWWAARGDTATICLTWGELSNLSSFLLEGMWCWVMVVSEQQLLSGLVHKCRVLSAVLPVLCSLEPTTCPAVGPQPKQHAAVEQACLWEQQQQRVQHWLCRMQTRMPARLQQLDLAAPLADSVTQAAAALAQVGAAISAPLGLSSSNLLMTSCCQVCSQHLCDNASLWL
jgi:hypothetical protein